MCSGSFYSTYTVEFSWECNKLSNGFIRCDLIVDGIKSFSCTLKLLKDSTAKGQFPLKKQERAAAVSA